MITRVRSLLLTVLAPLSVLAGCAVGPDYQRPESAPPASFNGAAAVAQRSTRQPADLARWWDGFGDPLLSQLVARSLDENLDIAQAVARVTTARAMLGSANAALLPSGTVQGQATKAHQSIQSPLGRVLNSTPDYDRNGQLYEGNVGASWEIDLFGGLRRDREAAFSEFQAAQAGAVATRLTIAAQTADTYIAIRGLQARLAIARQQVKNQTDLLATIQLQFDAGVAARLQLLQTQGALSEVQATIPVLETALDSACNALDVLLGVQPGTWRTRLDVDAPIPAAPAILEAGGPASLIRRRPDLIVAERQLAASNARIGAALSEYYPKFSLGGLVGFSTTTGSNVLDGGARQAQAVLGLRWRIFDFARVDAEIAAARGRNAEQLARYRLAVLQASEDVENAFSAVVKREQEVRALAAGEASLSGARDASMAAYQGGVVSLIEVLDADNRLLRTRDARAQSQAAAARAAVASFKALGGGWNPPDDRAVALAR
ncbi:efflux transporter outer membrane subunit [soil metagenome]